jgi:hypothetical protein
MKNELTRKKLNYWHVTAKGFACGYDERFGDWSNERGSYGILSKEGCYHVRGYDTQGEHFWLTFTYLAEARRAFAKYARQYRQTKTPNKGGN